MFPTTYFPSGSGVLYLEGETLKYRHIDGSVLTIQTVAEPSRVAGLQLWLKADAITGMTPGAPVATWPDASGKNRPATQATPERRPKYQAGARNGLPSLVFDGIDDVMDGLSATWRTVFAVVKASITPTAHMSLWGDSRPLIDMSIRRLGFGPNYSHENPNDFAQPSGCRIDGAPTNQVANGTWHILSCESPVARVFPYRVAGTGGYTPGRTWAGEIAELIVYDSLLSEADRARVERYLSFKYAISLA